MKTVADGVGSVGGGRCLTREIKAAWGRKDTVRRKDMFSLHQVTMPYENNHGCVPFPKQKLSIRITQGGQLQPACPMFGSDKQLLAFLQRSSREVARVRVSEQALSSSPTINHKLPVGCPPPPNPPGPGLPLLRRPGASSPQTTQGSCRKACIKIPCFCTHNVTIIAYLTKEMKIIQI